MEYPVQWDIIVGILGLFLVLVYNDGWYEALHIRSVKYK